MRAVKASGSAEKVFWEIREDYLSILKMTKEDLYPMCSGYYIRLLFIHYANNIAALNCITKKLQDLLWDTVSRKDLSISLIISPMLSISPEMYYYLGDIIHMAGYRVERNIRYLMDHPDKIFEAGKTYAEPKYFPKEGEPSFHGHTISFYIDYIRQFHYLNRVLPEEERKELAEKIVEYISYRKKQ